MLYLRRKGLKRLEDKPFALLGINSDTDREKLKEILADDNITWRSWWDGGSTGGPIATQWNVAGWPTTYVLDDQGVIRAKELGGSALDRLVDGLVREAEGREE